MGKCSSGQKSEWANIQVGKNPSGQIISGQKSEWANVQVGKNPSGQLIGGQKSEWASVPVGKCQWANDQWASVGGQMYQTRFH